MAMPATTDGPSAGYFGVYPALVTDIVDPDNLGRIEVRFPTLGTDGNRDVRAWATRCSPYADDDQGFEVLPEVGSQVVVAFEAGNLQRPYIIGSCWNGKEKPPRAAQAANNIRVLRSRSKNELEFDDTSGAEKISLTMKNGAGHKLVLDAGVNEVTIQHSNGSVIRMTLAGAIEITATLKVDVNATMVNVTAPISTFSGVVKCQTLIAETSVVSPMYTPGVGNIW